MIHKQFLIDTHPAILTMTKVLSSPHSTKSTIGAMIRPLLVVHPQVTNGTMILSKLCIAINAKVGFTPLPGKTLPTYNLLNGKTIHVMMFRRSL
jgi:hypothetical protein